MSIPAQHVDSNHHPYFNNHSPSRFQRQNYNNSHIQQGTTAENVTVCSISRISSPQRLPVQPPRTTSKFPSSSNQLHTGIIRIRSQLLKIRNCKLLRGFYVCCLVVFHGTEPNSNQYSVAPTFERIIL